MLRAQARALWRMCLLSVLKVTERGKVKEGILDDRLTHLLGPYGLGEALC
jgi:hypothetical protein